MSIIIFSIYIKKLNFRICTIWISIYQRDRICNILYLELFHEIRPVGGGELGKQVHVLHAGLTLEDGAQS